GTANREPRKSSCNFAFETGLSFSHLSTQTKPNRGRNEKSFKKYISDAPHKLKQIRKENLRYPQN
ncbi:unnamed protein product, partial [Larinioides sclopetarius]